jgi:tripartite-type tricarboxylate transporter receptor subunit TctC
MAVRNAPPDGVTLMVTPIATVAIYPLTYKALDYDPVKDFAPISQLATFDLAVAVAPNVPAASLAELIAWVKADANRAAFASPGAGSLPHFLGIMFGRATGLDMRQIAYRGSAAALTDLIAGHVPMLFTTVSDLLETHKAGRIRILATSGAARSAFTPEIPTFREAGFDLQGSGWYAAFAPAKTPAAIVNRYSTIMADAVRLPDVKERLLAYGLQPTGTTAAELAAIQKADIERLAPIVKASGFSAD